MLVSQHRLCARKMELALEVTFYLDFHWVTRPWRRTETNLSDVKYELPLSNGSDVKYELPLSNESDVKYVFPRWVLIWLRRRKDVWDDSVAMAGRYGLSISFRSPQSPRPRNKDRYDRRDRLILHLTNREPHVRWKKECSYDRWSYEVLPPSPPPLYKKVGDARRGFSFWPRRGTKKGVLQAFFDPWKVPKPAAYGIGNKRFIIKASLWRETRSLHCHRSPWAVPYQHQNVTVWGRGGGGGGGVLHRSS